MSRCRVGSAVSSPRYRDFSAILSPQNRSPVRECRSSRYTADILARRRADRSQLRSRKCHSSHRVVSRRDQRRIDATRRARRARTRMRVLRARPLNKRGTAAPRINPDAASARALSHRRGCRAENENGLNGFVETAPRSIRLARPRAGRKSFQPIPDAAATPGCLSRAPGPPLSALPRFVCILSLSLSRSLVHAPSIYPPARWR